MLFLRMGGLARRQGLLHSGQLAQALDVAQDGFGRALGGLRLWLLPWIFPYRN